MDLKSINHHCVLPDRSRLMMCNQAKISPDTIPLSKMATLITNSDFMRCNQTHMLYQFLIGPFKISCRCTVNQGDSYILTRIRISILRGPAQSAEISKFLRVNMEQNG